MKRLLIFLLAVIMILPCFAEEEQEEDYTSPYLYVTANLLNGRRNPSKRSQVETIFDKGDALTPTGEWSKDHKWVEIYGGESGIVWCNIKYLNEIKEPEIYTNRGKQKVKIRKRPFDGKVISYLKGGRSIEVTQIVNGWGKTRRGWIDLSYLVGE